ncbi:hypothetical protein ACFX13_028207 [Malus domestica]
MRGRKKIQMELIESQHARQVSFSKRRSSLFKNASELCTMCAVQVLLVIFSLGRKPFSFGHPSVHSVLNRFHQFQNPDASTNQNEATKEPVMQGLNDSFSHLLEQVKFEQKRGKKLNRKTMEHSGPDWLKAPMDSLNLEELRKVKETLVDVKKKIKKQRDELLAEPLASSANNSIELFHCPETNLVGDISSVHPQGSLTFREEE